MTTPTVLELFAGASGAALGLRAAGFESLACVELDADACATLRAAGFPVVETDVRDIDSWRRLLSGVLTLGWASFPCQCWSLAGSRLGAHDPRNGWPWTVDAIDAAGPTWVICENVPGLTYHDGDCDRTDPMVCPRCYLEAVIVQQLRDRFASVQWVILDAADFGVPQHRRRIFIVAGPRPIKWPQPTHGDPAQLALFNPLLPWVSIGQALGLNGAGFSSRQHGKRPHAVVAADAPSPTVQAGSHRDNGLRVDVERGAGMSERHGHRRMPTTDEPAPPIRARSKGAPPLSLIDPKHPPNLPDAPAGSIRSGGDGHSAPPVYLLERPAPSVTTTEIKGSRQGHGTDGADNFDRASDLLWRATGRRRLTWQECAILQDFPQDHPFQGTKTARYRQIGNAVPRTMARLLGEAVRQADEQAP
jgi:DNA (cytosine-5)-methyltransferase 1